MPKYVIHIGPRKAASKFLQSSLYALRDELKEAGIYYPDEWQPPRINQVTLIKRLDQPEDPELKYVFDRLNASSYRAVVMSSENFFKMAPEKLTALRGLLGGSPVDIVYYCRRWSERIPSQWHEHVKGGYFAILQEIYEQCVDNPRINLEMNPSLIWDRFSNIFGRESLKLISFNNLVDSKTDLLDHFGDAILNWRYAQRPTEIRSNVSPGIVDTEILRALNHLHHKATGQVSDRVHVSYFDRKSGLDLTELTEAIESDLGTLVLDDNAVPFRPVYADMEKYLDRVVNPKRGSPFFEKKVREFKYGQQNYLRNRSAVEALHRVYAAMVDDINRRIAKQATQRG